VIGGIDARSLQLLERLYGSFTGVQVLRTNIKTAEMIKYASNALLATMISFSNEFANLCSALGGIDAVDVMKGVHLSRYLSIRDENGRYVEAPITSFLAAGCGFGGSCLPKDVKALVTRAEEAGVPMRLLDAVMKINERQPTQTVALLKRHYASLEGLRVAVLGLAFKPDTSDIRESPAIPIIKELLSAKAVVKAHDPVAIEEFQRAYPSGDVEFCAQLPRAIEDVEAIVVVTRWGQFRELPELVKRLDPQPLVVDARRMLNKGEVARYAAIGLGG
jgi:UDPglucose 6-dehydrogenase